jgi:hypothetical protein
MHTKFWSEILKGVDHSGEVSIYRKILLECILGKQGGKLWTGCIGVRIGTKSLPFVNTASDPSGSIRGREFLDWMSDC